MMKILGKIRTVRLTFNFIYRAVKPFDTVHGLDDRSAAVWHTKKHKKSRSPIYDLSVEFIPFLWMYCVEILPSESKAARASPASARDQLGSTSLPRYFSIFFVTLDEMHH